MQSYGQSLDGQLKANSLDDTSILHSLLTPSKELLLSLLSRKYSNSNMTNKSVERRLRIPFVLKSQTI